MLRRRDTEFSALRSQRHRLDFKDYADIAPAGGRSGKFGAQHGNSEGSQLNYDRDDYKQTARDIHSPLILAIQRILSIATLDIYRAQCDIWGQTLIRKDLFLMFFFEAFMPSFMIPCREQT